MKLLENLGLNFDAKSSYLKEICQCCFDIIYLISLYDIDENFLMKLFKWITEKKFQFESTLHANDIDTGENECARLLFKLTSSLQTVHSTSFLRFPHSPKEPIEILLNSNRQNLFKSIVGAHKQNLNQMISQTAEKVCSFSIPITTEQTMLASRNFSYSYSLVFSIRFDSDLFQFASQNGLSKNVSPTSQHQKASESYAHVLSQSLPHLNSLESTYEIWLNSNGNLLFM